MNIEKIMFFFEVKYFGEFEYFQVVKEVLFFIEDIYN